MYFLLILKTISLTSSGLPIQNNEQTLKKNTPHIVVGTPGRMLALSRSKTLNLKNVKHFVLDECDKMLEALGTWIDMSVT